MPFTHRLRYAHPRPGHFTAAGIVATRRTRPPGPGLRASSTWVFSNHDVVRHASRYALPDGTPIQPRRPKPGCSPAACTPVERAPACAGPGGNAFMLGLPGSAYLYQGEDWLFRCRPAADSCRIPPGSAPGQQVKGRDGCRVPLPLADPRPPAWFAEHAVSAQDGVTAPRWSSTGAPWHCAAPCKPPSPFSGFRTPAADADPLPPSQWLGGADQLRRRSGSRAPRRPRRGKDRAHQRSVGPRANPGPRRKPRSAWPPDQPGAQAAAPTVARARHTVACQCGGTTAPDWGERRGHGRMEPMAEDTLGTDTPVIVSVPDKPVLEGLEERLGARWRDKAPTSSTQRPRASRSTRSTLPRRRPPARCTWGTCSPTRRPTCWPATSA